MTERFPGLPVPGLYICCRSCRGFWVESFGQCLVKIYEDLWDITERQSCFWSQSKKRQSSAAWRVWRIFEKASIQTGQTCPWFCSSPIWTAADAGCTKIWTTGSTVTGLQLVLSGFWMDYWVGHVDVAHGCTLTSWHANGYLFFMATWCIEGACASVTVAICLWQLADCLYC